MDNDQTSKIRQLVAALLRSDTAQRPVQQRPVPNTGTPTPQLGGLSGRGQQAIQNRGNQLNRAIDDAS